MCTLSNKQYDVKALGTMHTCCHDSGVQDQDFEFQDQDLYVQKRKAQLRNWLVEAISLLT